jgi:octaprenyl-diphosphate synthase
MNPTPALVKGITTPIRRELELLEMELEGDFSSEVGLISGIGKHLMSMKGKRVRPILVLLSAKMGDPDVADAVKVAGAVEMIHTATLLHDDSIDRSHLRRGLPTVNKMWNDQVSVIMGDYLFCRAFRMLHESGLPEIASILSRGSDSMTFGEMFQMDLRGRYDISEQTYTKMVEHKTAALFCSACEAGAELGGLGEDERSALTQYGRCLGVAFQIVDDILDFIGDTDLMGKPVGNDLRDGRITLPLIAALRNAVGDGGARVAQAITSGRPDDLEWTQMVSFIEKHDGVGYSRGVAESLAEQAKTHIVDLKSCPAKNSLMLLADRVVSRKK